MPETGDDLPVNFAEGVKDDIADLVSVSAADPDISAKAVEELQLRIAKLLVECRENPYFGELMGPGRHASLVACRRVRFDIPCYGGKPRFRLIYINYPADGAPAECRWLAVGPRTGLVAHRAAEARIPPP